ncbi:MAG: N-acetyltransferase family protein [Chitinivibrionales bacterium]
MINIQRVTENDLESLAGLYKQFWNEKSSVERMKAVFDRLKNNPDYLILVAKQHHRVIGSVMGIICQELYGDCKPFMVVEDMIVDKLNRRKGAGTLLMRTVEQYAKKRECSYIILITEQDRTAAHGFYESLGFDGNVYRGFKKRLDEKPHA